MKAKVWKVSGFFFIFIFALSAANVVHAVEVTAKIPVGTLPWGIAYDSGRGEILVANHDSNTVSVISDSNNTVVTTVPVGIKPVSLAYDSGKGEIFVTNNGAGTLSVIADNTSTVVATLTVGTNPEGVAYDSGTGEIFVANWGSNTTSVISDSNNTVIATVPVGDKPIGVAYDSAKGEIFVANSDSSGNGTVSVISDKTNTVIATVTVEAGAYYLAYDSGKGEIFVNSGGAVSVILDNNNAEIATMNVSPGMGIAYDPAKGAIFFSGSKVYGNGIAASVVVMSDDTYSILANLALPSGDVSYGAVYDPPMGEIFVPNGNSMVYVISDASLPSVSPSQTLSTLPSPTVPEFSSTNLILVLTAVVVVTLIAVTFAVKKPKKFSGKS
jgi:YVTN family beta-propeller protein